MVLQVDTSSQSFGNQVCKWSLLKQAVTHFLQCALVHICQEVRMNVTGLHTTMGSNTLEDLPLEALEMVLCLLDPSALVHFHAATGAGMPAIAQRVITMRAVHHCAHHWLHLSQRLSQHIKRPSVCVALRIIHTQSMNLLRCCALRSATSMMLPHSFTIGSHVKILVGVVDCTIEMMLGLTLSLSAQSACTD